MLMTLGGILGLQICQDGYQALHGNFPTPALVGLQGEMQQGEMTAGSLPYRCCASLAYP